MNLSQNLPHCLASPLLKISNFCVGLESRPVKFNAFVKHSCGLYAINTFPCPTCFNDVRPSQSISIFRTDSAAEAYLKQYINQMP